MMTKMNVPVENTIGVLNIIENTYVVNWSRGFTVFEGIQSKAVGV
jgi:hypothetical protein